MDGAGFQVLGKSGAVTVLSVTKPSGQADTQATGLVSFGQNPADATEITRGVGVYSTPYCLVMNHATNGLGVKYASNCAVSTAIDAALVTGTEAKILPLVNALEINWALPYAVPNDRTTADIVCKTEQRPTANTDAKKFSYDPLRIHQSAMIAKGWGAGNCFYLGVDLATPGSHRFQF
jgi:hypothetical protein